MCNHENWCEYCGGDERGHQPPCSCCIDGKCGKCSKCRKKAKVEAAASRIERNKLHMITAVMWATRSLCKRLKVGAVITSFDRRCVLSIGYNGPARGLPDNRCRHTQPGACGCLHAEDNAVATVDSTIPDKVIFVTHMPCEQCAQRIIQANVKHVCFLNEYRNSDGADVLNSVGIPLTKIDLISSDFEWVRAAGFLTPSVS